jgi:nuclear pore complex protein Nup85
MDKIPEKERTVVIGQRGEEDWWEKLSDIVGILEGRFEIVKRIVDEEFTGDWKDAVVAYGMFVNGRMRRQDLP